MTTLSNQRVATATKHRNWLLPLLLLCLTLPVYAVSDTDSATAVAKEMDATGALTFITGAAIAIERLIELAWTVAGSFGLSAYWPLSTIKTHVEKLTTDLTVSLNDLTTEITPTLTWLQTNLTDATQALAQAQATLTNATPGSAAATAAGAQVQSAQEAVNNAKQQHTMATNSPIVSQFSNFVASITTLSTLPVTAQNRQLLASAASQKVNYLTAQFANIAPGLQAKANVANAAIDGLQNFLATFKDNSGRRLISLLAGIVLGMIAAVCGGLNLFTSLGIGGVKSDWQLWVTGLVIGLGANPTHEVIRLVQEYKKSSKGKNIGTPNEPSNPKQTAK